MLIPGRAMITLATAPYTDYYLKLHDHIPSNCTLSII